ncbi:MAG: heavy-metal-associated domain-containing protein [Bacteroidetes bacterium]|nr:heavy-metal-associated domain-containing protein [Bacteroidota bacterium]
MRIIKLLLFAFSLTVVSCGSKSSSEIEGKYQVWGNCEICKATIEKASTISGVKFANWDVNSKLLTVKLDTTKTSINEVLKSVSAAGYDNEKFFADDYAYSKLKSCCQYERRQN